METDPFVSLLILYLTTPSSDFYISKLIAGSTDPTLEPFSASEVDLGKQTILGVTMDFNLQNLVVAGLSNVQVAENGGVPEITVNGNDVTFVAQTPNTQAPPPHVPSQLTLTAILNVVPSSSPAFSGNLTVTVNQTTINGAFTVSSGDGTPQDVSVVFTQVSFTAVANSSNISITLKMDNPLSSFINAILNQPAIMQTIITAIQGQLGQASILQALSQFATQAARTVLSQ